MILQKQKTKGKKAKKKYPKYVVVIPEETVKKAGFRKGTRLKAKPKKGEIKLVREKKKKK